MELCTRPLYLSVPSSLMPNLSQGSNKTLLLSWSATHLSVLSLVRIMGSTRSSRTKSSSKFHSSSESSTYQHLELGDSRKQLHKENTVLCGDKDFSVTGIYHKDRSLANLRENKDIQGRMLLSCRMIGLRSRSRMFGRAFGACGRREVLSIEQPLLLAGQR